MWSLFTEPMSLEMGEHLYFPLTYCPVCVGPFALMFLYCPSAALIFLNVT